MAEINKDKMKVYAGEIKEAVRLLRECTKVFREKFLQDDILVRSTKYNFVVVSQAAIDISIILLPEREEVPPGIMPTALSCLMSLTF